MKKIIYTCLLAIMVSAGSSCQKFLSELPTKGTDQPITDISQLEGILNDARRNYSPIWEDDYASVFSTDDIELTTGLYDASVKIGYPSLIGVRSLYYYTFKIDEIINAVEDEMWEQCYDAIYNYNLVLENASNVSGSETVKKHIMADAHFMRAYEMWTLANIYCLPYCEEYLNEPGLPSRKTTDMEENFSRMTLEETYLMIEDDLNAAMELYKEVNQGGADVASPIYKWRGSMATVEAFRTRLYLHMGRYDEAAASGAYALANKGSTHMIHLNDIEMVDIIDNTYWPETSLLTEAQQVGWGEFFYTRINKNNTMIYQASRSLMDIYDQGNDLRFRKFIYDGGELFFFGEYSMMCYITFQSGGETASGITLPEVMLNRAEALLRISSPDVAGAMSLVNELRSYRFDPEYDGAELTADDRAAAMEHVLAERRRELPYTYRWYDIRRFSVNEDPADDVTVTHTFYKVTENTIDPSGTEEHILAPGSRRYAIPINESNIANSQGQIIQNSY